MTNAYLRLRDRCLACATKPFLARGFAVKRCPRCQLGARVCICAWRAESSMQTDVVLLMHRDEVFKPTNTGRLIADLFPSNTYAFEWSRTAPPDELLAMLEDPRRFPVLVFPPDEGSPRQVHNARPPSLGEKRLTLVMLDGTWKQARKMYKSSGWLQALPLQVLDERHVGTYAVRQSHAVGQLSTAEAAAEVLRSCEEPAAAQLLEDYFNVFNAHYLATRFSTQPALTAHHARLADAAKSDADS